MESASSKHSSVASSPFLSPNIGALLKIRIISWSQETGLPVTIRVRVGDRTFNLHKSILCSRSGYFKKRLTETSELELPPEFPGGPESFEMIALFIYGSSTLIDPFNVAALRCAAKFLEMTEEHCQNNLCERFDLYLNQVVLQSWDDTLIVLQRCQTLIPLSEELLIVGRCIESLAFMACMEILDPERRRDKPVVTLDTFSGQSWSCEMVTHDLWIKDLIALPFGFFRRIIGSVGFYFALLSKALEVGLSSESRTKLQDQIASLLHLAQVDDFLIPKTEPVSSSIELAIMEGIFSNYVTFNVEANRTPTSTNWVVAELWDTYLSRIAYDLKLESKRFMKLVEIVPISCRENHDQLYQAINIFLQAHRDLSQEQKGAVCKYLNCQKLSQEACIEAVQNELMPLRLIVQALFVQQLNTHQAFKECSESFRFMNCGDFSGSLSSSRCPNSKTLVAVESPYSEGAEPVNGTLSFLLEQELSSLKKTLQLQATLKQVEMPNKPQNTKLYGMERRSLSKKRNPVGQVTGCINSVNLSSQRRYVSRLLQVFRRISLFGSKKLKRKPATPDLSAKSV